MKIGILGVGMIGKTLVQKLSAVGHDVKAANFRGPYSIDRAVFAKGGVRSLRKKLSGMSTS